MRTQIREFTIPEHARENFDSFVKRFSFNPYENPEMAMQVMGGKLQEFFPQELIETLRIMGETGDPGMIFIRNFPIDVTIPEAKTVIERSNMKGFASENAIIGTVGLMGYKLHSNPKEQNGRIIHNIAPVTGYEKTTSSKGRDPFYLHIENPFEQNPPDFLILAALEGDTCAKTTYFFVDGMIKGLPEWVVQGMKKPEFEIRSGAGFDNVEMGVFSLITREEDTGRLRLRLYQSNERIHPMTPEAERVMEHLMEVFRDVEASQGIEGVGLNPGEAIIINNGWGLDRITGVMHGRGGYVENPCRWLQRGFLYKRKEPDNEKVADGYFKAVSMAVTDEKNFGIKEASAILRKAMLDADDCRAYREAHPEATDAQVLLYGTNPKGPGIWLERVTSEAVGNSLTEAKTV